MFWKNVVFCCFFFGNFCSTNAETITVNPNCDPNSVNSNLFDNNDLGLGGSVVEERSETSTVSSGEPPISADTSTNVAINTVSSGEPTFTKPRTSSSGDPSTEPYIPTSLEPNTITAVTKQSTPNLKETTYVPTISELSQKSSRLPENPTTELSTVPSIDSSNFPSSAGLKTESTVAIKISTQTTFGYETSNFPSSLQSTTEGAGVTDEDLVTTTEKLKSTSGSVVSFTESPSSKTTASDAWNSTAASFGTTSESSSSPAFSSLYPQTETYPLLTLSLVEMTTPVTQCTNAICSLQSSLQELAAKVIAFLKDLLQKVFSGLQTFG